MKFLIFFIFLIYSNASTFSISVCTTSTKEGANRCKKEISKSSKLESFILHDKKDNKFRTYLGKFNSYKEAKNTLNISSKYIKKQLPFIKEFQEKKPALIKNLEFKNYLQELQVLNSLNKKDFVDNKDTDLFIQIKDYDELILEVDSRKNIMLLKANNTKRTINIKKYKVSTAKDNIKKPLGIGSITAISLEPQWYPTANTLKSFKQRGINLPLIVPFGHKLNYMGAAKINLSHKVNGRDIYRIHGTLNENTIRTNESAGCIRMKNEEVLQLAILLNKFADFKDFSNIKVILR